MNKTIHIIAKNNEKIDLPKNLEHCIDETDELIIVTTTNNDEIVIKK